MVISSRQNHRIKHINRLRQQQVDQFIVEGAKEISQALSRFEVEEFYYCPSLFSDEAKKIIDSYPDVPCYEVTPYVYQRLAVRDNREGLVAIFACRQFPLSELKFSTDSPLLVICQQLQKPGNLGAIIRTTLAVAADALIVIDQKMSIYNANVIRASLGYLFRVPLAVANSVEVFEFLEQQQITPVVVDANPTGVIYSEYNFCSATAVIFGSEAEGLSNFWRQKKFRSIYIPMSQPVDALNVAVCAGIILYEARRQILGKKLDG